MNPEQPFSPELLDALDRIAALDKLPIKPAPRAVEEAEPTRPASVRSMLGEPFVIHDSQAK